MPPPRKRIGILALQGSFAEHAAAFKKLGCDVAEIRSAEAALSFQPDALAMPGGESTAMMRLFETGPFKKWLTDSIRRSMPVLATCAGAILLSKSHLKLLDIEVDRNAYGSQLDSFESAIQIPALGKKPFHAVFIRAPKIKSVGKKATVLARVDGDPVLIQQANILAVTFHPELAGDGRLHEWFLRSIH